MCDKADTIKIIIWYSPYKDENAELKEQLEMLHQETEQLEQQHRQQMRNALDELQAIKEAHKNEIKSVQNSTTLQRK